MVRTGPPDLLRAGAGRSSAADGADANIEFRFGQPESKTTAIGMGPADLRQRFPWPRNSKAVPSVAFL
jgi:hypothetical protein